MYNDWTHYYGRRTGVTLCGMIVTSFNICMTSNVWKDVGCRHCRDERNFIIREYNENSY